MKKNILLGLSIIVVQINAQVGINTQTPTKDLQVMGQATNVSLSTSPTINKIGPTIRIDGLSNPNQNTSAIVKPVSVDQNGDLVYVATPAFSSGGILASPSVASYSTGTVATNLMGTKTITVLTNSLVRIDAVLSSHIYSTGGTAPYNSTKAVAYGYYFTLSNNPSQVLAEDVKSYVNSITTGTISGYTRPIYLNTSALVMLQPGTYTLSFYNKVYGNGNAFQVEYGKDYSNVDILITPI